MTGRTIISTLAVVAIFATPMAVLAQGPGPGDGPGAGYGHGGGHGRAVGHGFGPGPGTGGIEHMLPRLSARLDLSDEQVAAIENIIDARRPVIEAYAEQLREAREAYRASHTDPTDFDESTFRAHAEQQHQIRVDLMVAVHGARAEILSQLTPEQLAQLDEMRETRQRSFKRHRGRHCG